MAKEPTKFETPQEAHARVAKQIQARIDAKKKPQGK